MKKIWGLNFLSWYICTNFRIKVLKKKVNLSVSNKFFESNIFWKDFILVETLAKRFQAEHYST